MKPTHRWLGMMGLGLAGLCACAKAGDESLLDEREMVREAKIPLAEAPEAARKAILEAQERQGARLREVMLKVAKDGRRFYEAELVLADGGERDVLVTEDGRQAQVANEIAAPAADDPWQREFGLEHRRFSSKGRSPYFVLEPGYQLTLEGRKGADPVRLVITVLDETRKVAGVETRVVEEREWVNGQLAEVARNFLALCQDTHSVFYFGEEVDMYKDGKLDSHAGAWIAGENAAPGILIPGEPVLGARYYQEVAPGKALDRAEIVGVAGDLKTPAGDFEGCVTVEESTPLEPGIKERKRHAPGIGLVDDHGLLLVKHGFVK